VGEPGAAVESAFHVAVEQQAGVLAGKIQPVAKPGRELGIDRGDLAEPGRAVAAQRPLLLGPSHVASLVDVGGVAGIERLEMGAERRGAGCRREIE
jgi:hypothetical protein